MEQSVKARRLRVIEVFVRVGSGERAQADPAEVLHTAGTGHLVTAIQLLDGRPTAGAALGVLFRPVLTFHLFQGLLNHPLAIPLLQEPFSSFICL